MGKYELSKSSWLTRLFLGYTSFVVFMVPTLQRGNPFQDAPASRDAERHPLHSHAGAWERFFI
jgi:hypothetical protein